MHFHFHFISNCISCDWSANKNGSLRYRTLQKPFFLQIHPLCCRMAEVVLSIEEEVADFLCYECPLSPQAPTVCPVSSWGDNQKCSSFRDFMEHWSIIYHESDTIYKCKLCRRTYGTIIKKNLIPSPSSTMVKMYSLDPGDILPYQLGSPSYHSEVRKTQWSIQRKNDAERRSANLPDMSEEDKKP